MENKIVITKNYDLAKPTEAVQMAVMLKNIIVKQNLYTVIKGKNYAHVDAWQLAGFLSKLNVIVDEPKDLSNEKETKWSCSAKVYSGDKVVGTGYALCSSKEANKKGFDEYAILSMSQTRAIGKAYRNKIGFIMKLAGYQSTPAEEMRKVDETMAEPQNGSNPPQNAPQTQPEGIKCQYPKCQNTMSMAQAQYSAKTFNGKKLCREHQEKVNLRK